MPHPFPLSQFIPFRTATVSALKRATIKYFMIGATNRTDIISHFFYLHFSSCTGAILRIIARSLSFSFTT